MVSKTKERFHVQVSNILVKLSISKIYERSTQFETNDIQTLLQASGNSRVQVPGQKDAVK